MPFKNPHPLYQTWHDMKERCRNPKLKQWTDYGGRGIRVCDRWRTSFAAFVADMGERPVGYVLDRTDNDGNYEPSNCRWVSRSASQRNRRGNRWVSIEGVTYLAVDLADIAGKKIDTIVERAARGLTYEQVIAREKTRDLTGLALGGRASGKKQQAKTHCPAGHPYDETNTAHYKGWRRCRICVNARQRAYMERKRPHLA
jgi:hypothetical protein